MSDQLEGMRVFVQVVETGSFSATARALDLAPSSVSRQINDLEEELGVRLFHRTTRKLSLTEAGQVYYEHALPVISGADEARLAVSELGQPTGILRITGPSGISRVVVSALPEFFERYPGICVVAHMTDNVIDIVEQGIDVAIRIGRLPDSSLKARKVGESRRVVCASPEYLERHGTPKTPLDLANHRCITWRDRPGHNVWSFQTPDGIKEVRATGPFFSKSAEAIVDAALTGLGLCLLPDWNMGQELRAGELRCVLDDYPVEPGTSPVWALHAHDRYVPPKIRAFIDFMVEQGGGQAFS